MSTPRGIDILVEYLGYRPHSLSSELPVAYSVIGKAGSDMQSSWPVSRLATVVFNFSFRNFALIHYVIDQAV